MSAWLLALGANTAAAAAPAAVDSTDARLDRLTVHGDFVAAFQLAVQQLTDRAAEHGPLDPSTLTSLHRVGTIAHLADDQETAEQALDLALAWRRRRLGAGAPEVAETLYRRGLVAKYSHDKRLARQLYDDAVRILMPRMDAHKPLVAALAQARAELLLRADGRRAQCVRWYKRALRLREESLPRPAYDIADNLTWLGFALFEVGRHAEAQPYLAAAEAELRALHLEDGALMAVVLGIRADMAAVQENWPEAQRTYERAGALMERARLQHPPGFPRKKLSPRGYFGMGSLLLQRGRDEEAWCIIEQSRGLQGLDFLALSRWSESAPMTYAEEAALRTEWLAVHWGLDLSRLQSEDHVDMLQWDLFLRGLHAVAGMQRLEQEYLADCRPARVDPESLRAILPPRSAFIGSVQSVTGLEYRDHAGPYRNRAWAFVLRSDRPLQWIPLYDARSAAEYAEFRRPMDRCIGLWRRAAEWPLRVEADPEYTAALREVCRRWFDRLLPALDGIETLLVEASYAHAPLQSLIGPDGRFLGDRFRIAHVPSARMLVMLRERQRRDPPRGLQAVLAVGGALGRDQDGPAGATAAGDSLGWSAREVTRVAAVFPEATLLRGRDATEENLRALAVADRLATYDVVHFATHSREAGIPERYGLALAPSGRGRMACDGWLTAREILAGWNLTASVVTLGGCHTARGPYAGLDEFLGLQQVFLAVGARRIVTSLWHVEDRATSLFMQRFYEDLMGAYGDVRLGQRATPFGTADALREAQAWLRDWTDAGGRKPFEHPIYWSGFVLTGLPD